MFILFFGLVSFICFYFLTKWLVLCFSLFMIAKLVAIVTEMSYFAIFNTTAFKRNLKSFEWHLTSHVFRNNNYIIDLKIRRVTTKNSWLKNIFSVLSGIFSYVFPNVDFCNISIEREKVETALFSARSRQGKFRQKYLIMTKHSGRKNINACLENQNPNHWTLYLGLNTSL